MSRAGTCSRLWQAHAVEDGRLSGSDRASFEKHANSCFICSRETAELAELRSTMLQIPAFESTPLDHRRSRADLLVRANARTLRAHQDAPKRWMWIAAFGCFAVMASVALVIVGWMKPGPNTVESLALAPVFEVDDVDGAEWASEVVGSTVRAKLVAGVAAFHVHHIQTGQRFLLQLPDGQIEVHGTRFHVAIRNGVTSRVEVSEGVVALRMLGEPERRLRAGEAWTAAPIRDAFETPAAVVEPDAGNEAPLVPQAASNAAAPAGSARRQDVFAAAVIAFRAGNYARTEQLLDRFLKESPRDPRSEDAWFMMAVARSRAGDAEGARRVAKEYLERFPAGLRRREAEQLAAQGANH
ncbi:MAG: FecR domain-containing protein [Polyangiaceae bacterium]